MPDLPPTRTAHHPGVVVQRVLNLLPDARPAGERRWSARCPAHDDQRASLSVAVAGDGKVLLHCHAGCELGTILEVLRLQMTDLFAPRPSAQERNRTGSDKTLGQIEKTYDYQAADGNLLYQVVRFKPKDFRQRRPDGRGGYIWSLNGTPRVPYRLPQLLSADLSETVFIAEGEKDADRLADLGMLATANPQGAGKWSKLGRGTVEEAFRGRAVIILPDNDEPGRRHAQEVARSLQGVAGSVKLIPLPGLPDKGDVSDWLDAGHTADELRGLAERVPPVGAGRPPAHESNGRPGRQGSEESPHEPAGDAWEAPTPFADYPVPAFPVGVLPGWMAEYVGALSVATQTPPDLAGMLAIAFAGAAVARKFRVEVRRGWTEPLNLFAVVALPPPARAPFLPPSASPWTSSSGRSANAAAT